VRREPIDGAAHVEAVQNEFIRFIKKYGVAKTVFGFPYGNTPSRRILARAGQAVVGAEFDNQIFLLPFHTTQNDKFSATEIAVWVSRAIEDYRQKNAIPQPEWLDEFRFAQENTLACELEAVTQKKSELQAQLHGLKEYKGILTTSGENLRSIINAIFEDFFGLKVDPSDEGKEDGKILNENGELLAIFEVKGVKKGISRENINQVDSHRERNGLSTSTPAILIINNQMDVDGIEARLNTSVAKEQIEHAVKLRILIMRTIDLLFLMKHLEDKSISDRGTELLKLMQSPGGWLKADDSNFAVAVTSPRFLCQI